MEKERLNVAPSKHFLYHVNGERANGLILSAKPGSVFEVELGGEKLQIILWATNSQNTRLCFRASKRVQINRSDRGDK